MKRKGIIAMIIIYIILGLFVFSLIYFFTIVGMTNSKNKAKGGFIGAIGGILFVTLLFGAIFLDNKIDNEVWNNGVCPSCGEKWIFKSATATRGAHTYDYYYSCDNCHDVIRIHSMR